MSEEPQDSKLNQLGIKEAVHGSQSTDIVLKESQPDTKTQQEPKLQIDLEERRSTARRIFNKLALENAENKPGTNEVLEHRFREGLISAGISDIDAIIEYMEKDGLERVAIELDGVLCDILRRSE